MTKSPIALVREALAVGGEALPPYASRFSRKDFTQPQLFAIPVLQKFLKTDDRGITALLREWTDLRRALKLTRVPNYSTLWYAQQKLSKKGVSIGSCPRASLGLDDSG